MPVKMTFKEQNGEKKTTTIQNVMGYRISCCFTPGLGFQDRFYVYVFERVEASVTSADREKIYISPFTKEGHLPEGDLSLEGDRRTYKFQKIQLAGIECGITRRERFRILEFYYPKNVIDDGKDDLIDVKNNEDTTQLQVGLLKDDYKAGLGGSEQLMGSSSAHSGGSVTVYRWSKLRNKTNSWMKQVVETHQKQTKSEEKKMEDFTITFTRKDIKVTRDNLRKFFVDESYGEMLKYPLPSMHEILDSVQSDRDLARLNHPSYTPEDLNGHEDNRGFRSYAGERTLETATIVLKQGEYQDIKMV